MQRVIVGLISVCLLALVFSTTAFAQRRGGHRMSARIAGHQRSFQNFNRGSRQRMSPMRQSFGHQRSFQRFNRGSRQYMPMRRNYGYNRSHQQFNRGNRQYTRGSMHRNYGNNRYQQRYNRWNRSSRRPCRPAAGPSR